MTKDIENEIQSWISVRSFAVEDANPDKPIIDANEVSEFISAVFKKLEGCVVVPVESCKWTQDEDSNWWTQCGEGFVFNEDSHPHKHNFKNCCFCGGLLEAARGGNE